MKDKILLFILLLLLVGCVSTPGPDKSEATVVKSNLRTLEIECFEESVCARRTDIELYAVAFYIQEECRLFDEASEIVAMSSNVLRCPEERDKPCVARLEKFENAVGEEKILVPEGEYALVAFVDLNQNLLPDQGEPYFCSHSVEISIPKRLVNIVVQISRTFE